MKAPYVVYADFECLVKKISTCEPNNKQSFTMKTEKHEPCGFSYTVVRSDGTAFRPATYRGEDAVYVFLRWLLEHEKQMREDMANKRPLEMTNIDWQKHRNATESQICNKSLYKDLYLDSMEVYHPDSGKYCRQSHRRCYHQAAKNRYAPRKIRKPRRHRSMDHNTPGNMPVLCRSAACAKLQRFCERSRPHDGKISRCSAQRLQLQA